MWDCNGLEHLDDITDYEHWDATQTFEVIKGNKPVENPLWQRLGHMKLRAQFNNQRFYEIYAFTSDDITKEDFIRMFETSPQCIADLIRATGVKIYSDRRTDKPVIV
jgi:hypothetical protein